MDTKSCAFTNELFSLVPDPRSSFLTDNHEKILNSIVHRIVERNGLILVTGEMGSGKTTLVQQLMRRLDSNIRPIHIVQPPKTFDEILEGILRKLDLPVQGRNKKLMLSQLNEYLVKRSSQNETLLLILDEAQDLSPEIMEELRLLCNSDPRKPRLLQEVFVAEPKIEDKLKRKELRQLQQRITVRCRLHPLSESESRQYLQYHLWRVGKSISDVFTPDAARLICRYSKGSPRIINILSYISLSAGYALSKTKVDATVVEDVCSILDRQKPGVWKRMGDSIKVFGERLENSPLANQIAYALVVYSFMQWIILSVILE